MPATSRTSLIKHKKVGWKKRGEVNVMINPLSWHPLEKQLLPFFPRSLVSNVSAVTGEMSVCTFKERSLNYPRWLSTVKGFPSTVIMAHSNSIYQQAKAITASMDFDYWLYALMTSNLLRAHFYFTQMVGRKPPFMVIHPLLLLPFSPAGANISCWGYA